ncbi:MAG: PKD domain-containing protein [bacterium]
MKNASKFSWMIYVLLIIPLFISCKKKTTEPDVIASFTYVVDATDFKKIAFTSASQNYASLSWNFGDNTALSAEINPVHTYAAMGTYAVMLVATSPAGVTDSYTVSITVSDPNAELTKLVGDVSKTWKLLRSTATGRYPLEVGPIDHSTIWWAVGKGNDELAIRHCMLNDEWTFGRDGSLVFDAKGDYWREGGIFDPANTCGNTTDPMVGIAPGFSTDLSSWGNGNHTFQLTAGANPTLKAIGKGAFVGFYKLGNDAETTTTGPQDFVTYNVVKLTDGVVDTLVIEGNYHSSDPTFTGGYWRFVLMHYDNPADEPPIPGNKPNASFTSTTAGLTVTFTNTTADATSYLWDFGDGQTSTAMSPSHTYATQGIYNVSMTATNSNGSSTATAVNFLGADLTTLTEAMLIGAPWRVKVDEKTVFVGGALGSSAWWALPKSFLVSGTGGDDWTCMPDDEFTFKAAGVFTYATMGSARNDGYFDDVHGCISDAGIAASGNGAAFGSATHSFAFTPGTAATRPIITLTNGAGFAAFIGFYKGYYGGENADKTKAPNGGNATNKYEVMGYANSGTKEYLFVTVDISAGHDGSAAWSAILER